jgi:uncharacterized protein DUF559
VYTTCDGCTQMTEPCVTEFRSRVWPARCWTWPRSSPPPSFNVPSRRQRGCASSTSTRSRGSSGGAEAVGACGRSAASWLGTAPPPATRSELERRFLDLCHEAGVPPPAIKAWVEGFEVDALWPGRRLVVELDGHAFHHTRAAFERDRVRDASLQLAGYRVLRLTHRRLEVERDAVAETVRSLLGEARPGRSASPPRQVSLSLVRRSASWMNGVKLIP